MYTKSKTLGNRTQIPRSAAYSLVTILTAPVRFHMIWYMILYNIYDMIYDMIYLSTAIGLSPGGSSTVHIYTQTIRITQITTEQHK